MNTREYASWMTIPHVHKVLNQHDRQRMAAREVNCTRSAQPVEPLPEAFPN